MEHSFTWFSVIPLGWTKNFSPWIKEEPGHVVTAIFVLFLLFLIGKKINKMDSRVFTLMGDGELDEGSVWEAAMSANKYKLDNLIAITDRNGCNLGGPTEQLMPLESLEDKWKSFGWTVKTIDGHSVSSLYETLKSVPFEPGKPSFIIAKTIKGKGLSCFEGDYRCHYVQQDKQKWEEAYKELSKACNQ